MRAVPGFEFCAFSFLAQWQEDECALYNEVSLAPTEEGIRKALTYFQVARNFSGLENPETIAFIVQSLIEVRNDPLMSSPHEKVNKLAASLQKRFNQYNLSAASKLLWLSYREPYIVYDSRAVRALTRDFGHRFDERDYAAYSNIWRQEYETRETSIQTAVEQLPKGRMFMRSCLLSDQELIRMARETWFMERVFDIFLWEVGAVAG